MKFSGTVIEGDGVGKQLGFPTANIDRDEYQQQNLNLAHGVYAGMVSIEGNDEVFKAGIVVGPEDQTGLPKLEAHLIGFSGDIYGVVATFTICAFLRPFEEYENTAALTAAITNDIEIIQKMDLCLPE